VTFGAGCCISAKLVSAGTTLLVETSVQGQQGVVQGEVTSVVRGVVQGGLPSCPCNNAVLARSKRPYERLGALVEVKIVITVKALKSHCSKGFDGTSACGLSSSRSLALVACWSCCSSSRKQLLLQRGRAAISIPGLGRREERTGRCGCRGQARALGLLGLERERSMGEQLRQAAAKMAELRAGIRTKDAAKADDALLEFKFQSKEAAMQSAEQGRVDRGESCDHPCERRSETPPAEQFTAPR
jgi:hypothetical protein